LRGPLTRAQIKLLMDPLKATAAPPPAATVSAPAPVTSAPPKSERAILPPDVSQYYIPVRSSGTGTLTYHPMLLGTAEIRYSNSKTV
jgi:hypothetical protein